MNEKNTQGYFGSIHPWPATSGWVTKNFRGEERIILVDLAPPHTDVNVVSQSYLTVGTFLIFGLIYSSDTHRSISS